MLPAARSRGVQQFQASRAASAPAAMLLCAAVMELVSQRIPQLLAADRKAVLQAVRGRVSSSATSMSVDWQALQVSKSAAPVLSVVSTIASYLPDTGSAACMPEFTRLLTLTTFVACQAMLLHDRTASTAASTDSSGSSSNSGGVPTSSGQPGASTSQADKPHVISRRHLRAAHEALSPCDTALLQLLGFSSEAAAWIAGALIQSAATNEVAGMAQVLLLALKGPTGAAGTVPAQQQAPTQQQLNLSQQMLLLVPAMLLRWAAQATAADDPLVPDQPPSAMHPQPLAALSSSHLIAQRADIDSIVNTALDYAYEWQLQQQGASHRPACATSSTAGSAGGAGNIIWLQPYLPAEWLQQVFPDIHTACSTREVARVQAAYPSVLVRFQTHLIAWAERLTSRSDVTAAWAPAGDSTRTGPHQQQQQQQQQRTAPDACSTGGSSSWFEPPQPLPAALATFQGVPLQTIASFDSFARSAAQHIPVMQGTATSRVEEAALGITGLCCSANEFRPGPLLALVQAAGPGSGEQQALYSCLRSIVKLATVCVAAAVNKEQWEPQFFQVACAAVLLLALPVAEQTGRASAAAGGSSTQSPAPAAKPPAAVYLPSLMLLGCALQVWAQQLERTIRIGCSLQQMHGPGADLQQVTKSSVNFERLVQRVLDWLADSSVMQQLAAAGYGVQPLPAMLQGLLTANAAALLSLGGEDCIKAATTGMQTELEAAAAALTALAYLLQQPGLSETSVGPLSWCQGAAVCVAGAVWHATAAALVSARIARSTSVCARRWQQLAQQQGRRLQQQMRAELEVIGRVLGH